VNLLLNVIQFFKTLSSSLKKSSVFFLQFFTSAECQAELVEAGIFLLIRLRQAQADSFSN
jgi:hypothetical protein